MSAQTTRPDLDALISDHEAAPVAADYRAEGLIEPAEGRADAPHVDDVSEAMEIAEEVFRGLCVDGDEYEGCRTHTDIRIAPAEGVLGKMTPAVFRFYVQRQIELSMEPLTVAQFNGRWKLLDARMRFGNRRTWRIATPPGGNPEAGRYVEAVRVDEVRRYVTFAFTFVDIAGTSPLEYENGRPKTGNALPEELSKALQLVFNAQTKPVAEAAAVPAPDYAAELEKMRETIASLQAQVAATAPAQAPAPEIKSSARSEIDAAFDGVEVEERPIRRTRRPE